MFIAIRTDVTWIDKIVWIIKGAISMLFYFSFVELRDIAVADSHFQNVDDIIGGIDYGKRQRTEI